MFEHHRTYYPVYFLSSTCNGEYLRSLICPKLHLTVKYCGVVYLVGRPNDRIEDDSATIPRQSILVHQLTYLAGCQIGLAFNMKEKYQLL
jgi:hypothetical protein